MSAEISVIGKVSHNNLPRNNNQWTLLWPVEWIVCGFDVVFAVVPLIVPNFCCCCCLSLAFLNWVFSRCNSSTRWSSSLVASSKRVSSSKICNSEFTFVEYFKWKPWNGVPHSPWFCAPTPPPNDEDGSPAAVSALGNVLKKSSLKIRYSWGQECGEDECHQQNCFQSIRW